MKSKRIAVIFEEDIYTQRGMFNAIRNRIRYLNAISDFIIDVYVIGRYEPWYIRELRHTKKVDKIKTIRFDGINYNTLWYNFTLTDYFFEVKLQKMPIFTSLFYCRLLNKFKGYDMISAHSINCGLLASRISARDNIPFCVTWHGSDIHTTPFISKSRYNAIYNILNTASYNFFVSEQLQCLGLMIAPKAQSAVLYNGKNECFTKYPEKKRKDLRKRFDIPQGAKVIAFVGNLIEVKNPHLLAPIFLSVRNKYKSPVLFWIIGSGKLSNQVETSCQKLGLQCKMWGGCPAEEMPDFYNCIDVLVLPSRNEGLPLVTVEALACGANVVGSDVGGIKEAIGIDNVFSLGETFVEEISERIVQMLTNKIEQPLFDKFDWRKTAMVELNIYNELLVK